MRNVLAWLGVATSLVLCASRPAFAQSGEPLKPYIVFAFDTSGSMGDPTNSGPPSCGGSDTRLNHARCAVSNIINSYGEMVFALARFRTTVSGTTTSSTFPTGCCARGPDVGGSSGCSAGPTCNNTSDMFEMLTGLVDGGNQQAANWVNFTGNTCTASGSDPEIWAATGNTPLEGTLRGAKRYWLGLQDDGLESPNYNVWPSGNPGFDPIRNDPTKTAFLPVGCDPSPTCTTNCCATQCRPYIVILLTDGNETCGGNPSTAAASLLATDVDGRRYRVVTKPIGFGISPGDSDIEAIAHAGGAPDLPQVNEGYYATDETDLQLAISQILADAVRSESCNDLDDDCDTLVDEDFPDKGGSCNNGETGICFQTGTLVCAQDGTLTCTAPPGTPGNEGTVCNQMDDDCDGKVDEGLDCQSCVPVGEICNNKDDDCDGKIDEALTRACGQGRCPGEETCTNGTWDGCTAQTPTAEICNGIDDDCDGVCDGFQLDCSDIKTSGGPATDNPGHPGYWPNPDAPETSCNDAIDNDLDGLVNDGCPAVGAAETACADATDDDGDGFINDGCPVPSLPIAQNICRPGVKTCPALCDPNGNDFDICSGEVKPCNGVTPCTDPCNGLDDDCDNKIDEDFNPEDCSTNCGVGQTQCVNGTLTCNSTPAMDDITCDNVDDDCDNKIDEDWMCADPVNGCPCDDEAVCNGLERCINGQVVCQGPPKGDMETCNCEDEDCDGKVDENAVCPQGATCTNCQCAYPCAQSEFPCPLGKKCEGGFCVNDPCYGVTCPPMNGNAQTCVPDSADPNEPACVDTCSVTTCSVTQVCIPATGECKPDDCTTFPERCASNQVCIVGMTGLGQCVSNPCAGVTCPAGKYCLGGTCVSSCADVTCPEGQRCRQGMCEIDPCGGPCPFGYACNDSTGQCIEDPCKFRDCPQGQWCNPNNGQCEDDPCVANEIECPNEDEICRGGTCLDPETLRPDAAGAAHVTVGGGGGCRTTGDTGGLLVIGLALLGAARRRRRGDVRDGGAS